MLVEDIFGVQEEVKTDKTMDLSLVGTVKDSLAAIVNANHGTFEVVERLAKGEPVTYAEIFKTDRGLNVFGELYPDLPEFHQTVDQQTAQTLIRRYISTARALNTAAKRVEKFNDTFAKKMQRRVKALARMHKGFSKLRKQFLQTIRVEDLQPFDILSGEYRNALRFQRKAVIELEYTDLFQLGTPPWSVPTDAMPTLQNLVMAVLDHTEAFRMATQGKVERTVQLTLTDHKNGFVLTATSKEGKLTWNTQHIDPSSDDLTLQVRVTYTLQVAKTNLDNALDILESLRLPLFHANWQTYLSPLMGDEA